MSRRLRAGAETPAGGWRVAALLGCIALASACAPAGEGPRRPDVLLITIDTLRADHLHGYGFELETSPNLDALARQGVLFERAIASASATNPAHASIMTSLYPREHTIGHSNGETRLERDATLAELFQRAGYRTAAFVGNLVLQRRTGFDRGFDLYDDEFDRRERNRLSFERIAENTTRRALAWLAEPGDDPYFLWVHYQDPHGPYTPPAEHVGRFRIEPSPDEAPLPIARSLRDRGGIPEYQKLEGLTRLSEYRGRYADEIFYADLWIGRLLEAVDAGGRPPIVLVTADHGESMGEHDRYFIHFWTTTPENAHVPMILRAPGIEPGRRSRIVSHVDVMPTLLELAGLDGPSYLRGITLGPHLRRAMPLPERSVFCDAGHEVTAYRGQRFIRVQTPRPAKAAAAAAAAKRPTRSIAYRWDPDGRWSPMRRDVELPEELLSYVATPSTTVRAPLIDEETRERLWALGYESE